MIANARKLWLGGWAAWEMPTSGHFEGHGSVTIDEDLIRIEAGNAATGIAYRGPLPSDRYRIELAARRTAGSDFFCGLTFPVGGQYCSLIIGGWGGGVTGLSCLDGKWAVDNDTTGYLNVESERWYAIGLEVSDAKIQATIDSKRIVNVSRDEFQFSVRPEIEPSIPIGLTTWKTTAEIKQLELVERP
jgi:hypothetical protein